MKSIYNPNDNQEIVHRISLLSADSKPLWGKMAVDQMCEHCLLASNVAFGKQKLKVNFLMRFLGKAMKNKILNSTFKKESPTAKEFIVTDNFNLEEKKQELATQINRFSEEGTACIEVMDHPFWGKMSYEDWDKLMYNHIDHHLRQFGV